MKLVFPLQKDIIRVFWHYFFFFLIQLMNNLFFLPFYELDPSVVFNITPVPLSNLTTLCF